MLSCALSKFLLLYLASGGRDYTLSSSVIAFPAGSNMSCFSVTIVQDEEIESLEVFEIRASLLESEFLQHVSVSNFAQINITDDERK